MSTTPPFMPGEIPGLGSSSGTPVPGVPTPQGAPQGQMGGAEPDKAKQILAAILQASQRKQMANTAVASPVPGGGSQQDPMQAGMGTQWPHAWSGVRFAGSVGSFISTAIAAQKKNQLLKAEGDWSYLQSAMNEKFDAEQSGNPEAIKAAQAKLDVVLQDPKKLKNMAKALNQDWLNPEKTTVYGEALKKVTAKGLQEDQTKQKKAQAAEGLKGMFQKLIQKATGQGQKPQLDDQQRQAMGREIQEKAPTTHPTIDPKMLIEQEKAEAQQKEAEASLIRAHKASPEKYRAEVISDPADPTGQRKIAVAFDMTDPTKPYTEIKGSHGESARPGARQYVDDGKLEVVGGIPTGRVKREGKWIAPGDPGYTKDDAAAVGLGLNAQGLSENQKERLASIRGASYARTAAQYRFTNVVNKQTGEVGEVSAIDMATHPGLYGGASEQEKISMRDAVHESLNTNFKALDESLDKLPNGLDLETQATIKAALRADNPGMIDTLIVNKVKQGMPDEFLQYLTNIKAMQEDILTLRTVGGMGQGSDMMRHAMMNLIPGAGSSSVKEAKMQMQAAKRTSEALFSRRPQSKLPENTGGGPSGTVTFKEGNTVYHIPEKDVAEFQKDKPKAVKVQ